MLQQTRVEVVRDFFRRFIKRFPTIKSLAAATEQDVLSLWSGLGYYRRARMLRQAAIQVREDFGGRMPHSSEELRTLPGIGRYTASAIASICYGEKSAVVDGNVERVLTRICGKPLSTAEQWEIANKLISGERPGDFNQAMMELGATVCTPKQAKCGECPVSRFCQHEGDLPSAPREVRKRESVSVVVDVKQQSVKLVRRPLSSTLMAGMWELPSGAAAAEPIFTLKHSITVTDFTVSVHRGRSNRGKYFSAAQAEALPLTGLTRKILRRSGFII